MNNLDGNYQSSLNFQTQTTLGGTGAPVQQQGVTLADFDTQLFSLGYTNEQISKYMNNPGTPLLVTPNDVGVQVFDTNQALQRLINNIPDTSRPKTFGEQFQERLTAHVNDPAFMQELGNISPEIKEVKIKLALLDPDNLPSEEIKKALGTLTEGLPPDWLKQGDIDQFTREIGQKIDNAFLAALAKLADPKDMNALKNAYYNQSTDGLTEEQKASFDKVMASSQSELSETHGIPPNLKIPSPGKERFNIMTNLDFEDEFITKISEMKTLGDAGAPGGITEKEFNTLRMMLYFKDPSNPEQAKLESQFTSLYEGTLAEFKSERGFPATWSPTAQTAAGQGFADGQWRDAFVENLNKLDIPQDLKNQILQGLANPAGASPIVKTMLETLISQTTAEVIENLGLPANWKPVATKTNPNIPLAALLLAKAGIKNLKAIYDIGMKALAEMSPNDPSRALLMDYLKRIGDSLNKLQETLYLLEIADSKNSKTMGLAMQDMQQNKIDMMAKQAEEAREQKNSKGYKKKNDPSKKILMGILMPIFLIALIVICVITVVLLPLVPILLFLLADSFSQTAGFDLMTKTFEIIGNIVAAGLPPDQANAVRAAVKAIILTLIAISCFLVVGGIAGTFVGMMFFMSAIPKSGFVADAMRSANPDVTEAEIAKVTQILTMTTMAFLMTVMIIQMIALVVLSMGTAFAPISAALAPIGAAISAELSAIGAELSVYTTIVMVGIINTFPAVGEVMVGIMEMVTSISSALTFLGEILGGMGTIVSEIMAPFIGTSATATSSGSGITGALGTASSAIGSTFQAMGNAIVQGAKNLVDLLRIGLQFIAKAAPENMKELSANLASEVKSICDQLMIKIEESVTFAKMLNAFEVLSNIVRPGSAEGANAAGAGGVSSEVANTTGGAASRLQKIAGYLMSAGDIAQGTQQTVSGIMQAKWADVMAEITRMQARREAYIEEVDALIRLLKKLIESMMNGMQPIVDFIKDVSDLQSKKFTDSSSGAGWAAVAS